MGYSRRHVVLPQLCEVGKHFSQKQKIDRGEDFTETACGKPLPTLKWNLIVMPLFGDDPYSYGKPKTTQKKFLWWVVASLSGDSQSLSDSVTETELKSFIREHPAHRTENARFRKCRLLAQQSCSPTSPPLPDFQHDFHTVTQRESHLCKLCKVC